ncbi:MAG: hypothetical protein QM820_40860 [Minicystis sp.]
MSEAFTPLLIVANEGRGAQAVVANTELYLTFVGSSWGAQQDAVLTLARSMETGLAEVEDVILHLFVEVPEGMTAAGLTNVLYRTTNALSINGADPFLASSVEADALIDCLGDAGRFLAEAISLMP